MHEVVFFLLNFVFGFYFNWLVNIKVVFSIGNIQNNCFYTKLYTFIYIFNLIRRIYLVDDISSIELNLF